MVAKLSYKFECLINAFFIRLTIIQMMRGIFCNFYQENLVPGIKNIRFIEKKLIKKNLDLF